MTHWTNDHLEDEWPQPRLITFTVMHLVVLLFLTFTIGWLVGQLTKETQRVDPQVQITEDDPDWDCRTMGNQVCGPKATAEQDKVNAQAYADWCGGYVQTMRDDRTVVGCTR